ncbi:MAG: porin, partial [Leptospiraceae bacterium]|nr:porin [Leptospiraceae bacterium]
MKVKSFVLGSAAAILAVTGAQAADLPIAEPVEYVRICDTYGTGFFYIPGTETCLRIGGRVRAELRYSEPEFV